MRSIVKIVLYILIRFLGSRNNLLAARPCLIRYVFAMVPVRKYCVVLAVIVAGLNCLLLLEKGTSKFAGGYRPLATGPETSVLCEWR